VSRPTGFLQPSVPTNLSSENSGIAPLAWFYGVCFLRLKRLSRRSSACKPALHFRGTVRYSENECALHHEVAMRQLKRITVDPQVMGGKPCIRNLRVTVGTIVGLIGAGRTTEEVLDAYPYLERKDILEAISYAALRAMEIEVSLAS
jgi:uncharacterized protein (DUF433 family)